MTTAQRVCDDLDLRPEDLADLFKREAARLLRTEAQLLDQHWSAADPLRLVTATHWLHLAKRFETEYDRRVEAEGDAEAADMAEVLGEVDSGGGPAVGGESLHTDPAATSPPDRSSGGGR